MMEAGVLLDLKGEAIYWHTPHNRSVAALPDSVDLWNIIWSNRENVSGFAHSHPGYGSTGPSWTDLTTFEAVESGLGKRLDWWITSGNRMFLCRYCGPDKHDYSVVQVTMCPDWVGHLREISGYYR
jgi:hypothetical protein